MEIPLKLCIPCSRQGVVVLEGAKKIKDYNKSLSKKQVLISWALLQK